MLPAAAEQRMLRLSIGVTVAVSLLVVGSHARATFTDPSSAAAQAILLYLSVYLFMNLGAFTVAGLVARETGGETLGEFSGLARRSPLLAVVMTAFLFSLVGLPPLAGFVAKVYVLWVLIQDGGWWWALVAVIGLNTVLSLYYYLRVVRVMYLEDSGAPEIAPNPLGTAVSVVCAAVLVLMFVGFSPLARLTQRYGDLHDDVAAGGPTTRAAPVAGVAPTASAR